MASNRQVERGQRYCDVHLGLFGTRETEWIVDDLFQGTDGVFYARLVCASDFARRKTLSVDILSNRRRFQRT